MKWILIFWIEGVRALGSGTAEFNNFEACESAVEKIRITEEAAGWPTKTYAFCTPKGSEE